MTSIPFRRARALLDAAGRARVLILGDLMLDHFLWGSVTRISPEAPVPVVEFERESFMPGGAANVARNVAALGARTLVCGVTGRDQTARHLVQLLAAQRVDCRGVIASAGRVTSRKVRVIAHQQQVARVDRETREPVSPALTRKMLDHARRELPRCDAVIVGDYGKGVVTQPLLDGLRVLCRDRGIWLSVDPKPVHDLDLSQVSLITPNRKEAFEMAGRLDTGRTSDPRSDRGLREMANCLLDRLRPALLLITLGDQGMLLCVRGRDPYHIPTMAQEVFDVSGAGDTVIAVFTLAIAAGASPEEAAILSNHAAGVVVGKVGTAMVTPAELAASFHGDDEAGSAAG
jgi:D-beta-D-heptose 7-phosphate kinase/D-beta-D-heptose 1-phosphate adenosyltransferase